MKYIAKNSNRLLLILIILPVLLTGSLLSDTPENKEEKNADYTFVDEIVVKGDIIEETATVETVTAEEIKAKGVKTVAEALELVPGAYVRVGGKGEAYVRMRGFRQREIAVLIDGIPVSSPYDGQLDLSSIPVEAIERIEVVKGAASILYGANAMGGVINIITRKSDGSQDYSFRGEYGSNNSLHLGLGAQGAVSNIRYLVSGSYANQDSFPLSGDYGSFRNEDGGDRENSDRKSMSARVSLGWDMGKHTTATLNFNHVDQVKGLPHHENDSKAKFWRFNDWRLGILDMVLQGGKGAFSYKSKLYYEYLENVLDSYDDATYTTQESKYGFTDSLKDRSLGGDLFLRYDVKKHHLFKMALRFRNDLHRQKSDEDEPWRKYSMNILSLPIEGEWLPSQAFNLTYGVSFDMMFFDTDEEVGTIAHNTHAINPQIAALVRLSDALKFRISASRKTRFPTLKELFSTTSGNPELEPMKSNTFEAGFDFKVNKSLTLSAVGFYNDIKDLINRLDKYDPYINIDKAVFKGIETGIMWQFNNNSRLSLAYTYLNALDKTTEDSQYIEHRPKHKFDADFRLALPADMVVNIFGSYVSSQFYYDDDVEFTLDPFTILDFKLTKNFGHRWSIYIKVSNLFDVDYYESEGYPREGRMIFAGFRYAFQ